MKALIIGGGIAGLASAITLRKAGCTVSVKERAPRFTEVGLGFIILPNGLDALDQVGAGAAVRAQGKMIRKARIRDPQGRFIKEDNLDSCIGVKRSAVIDALREQVPDDCITTGSVFSSFEFDSSGHAVAAVFANGERAEADLFIAADGANSAVRKILFPDHPVGETRIKELVGLAELPELVKELDGSLLKTQSTTDGLAIGLLPCNEQQVIWYMQFDCLKRDIDALSNENKKRFATEMLSGWPDPIRYVLEHSDYDRTFMWFTRDMPVLPAFHRNNIVLTGDAAHLVLPFTSQGVNSALQDAIILGRLLAHSTGSLDDVFTTYHHCRREILEEYHLFGNMMARRFLDPLHYKNEDVPIPLAK